LEGAAAQRAGASRAYLAFIVAACVVPAALIGAALVGYDYYKRERARIVRDTTATARALGAAVDMELGGVKAALFALSTSPLLAAGDYAGFHAQASAALKNQNFDSVVLLDASGQQLLNTLRPYGAALPATANPAALRDLVETRQPVITDLFTGLTAQRPLVAVWAPVVLEGRVRYALNAGVSAERVYSILREQHLPPAWVGGIFDREGTVVARTHESARFVGQKGAPELVRRIKDGAREGALETVTLEGIPVLTVFSRSPVSGWTVALGIPEHLLVTELWYSMARLLLVTVLTLGIALGLALVLSGRLARPIR